MVQVGDRLPAVKLYESSEYTEVCPTDPGAVDVAESARGKRVVLFGLPGAYTPTCSRQHVPGFVKHLAALKAVGVAEVWCVSVNDGYVMAAWGRELGALGKLRMLGDGNGELTAALGLTLDCRPDGMGVRSQRYALVVDDGVVTHCFVEPGDTFGVSSAEHVLQALGGS